MAKSTYAVTLKAKSLGWKETVEVLVPAESPQDAVRALGRALTRLVHDQTGTPITCLEPCGFGFYCGREAGHDGECRSESSGV